MIEHWQDNGPPVYMSVAGYLGLIPERKSKDKQEVGDLRDLIRMFPGGVIGGGRVQ